MPFDYNPNSYIHIHCVIVLIDLKIIFSEVGTHLAILERMQLWKTTAVPYDIKVS